jgi:hypothetical protein
MILIEDLTNKVRINMNGLEDFQSSIAVSEMYIIKAHVMEIGRKKNDKIVYVEMINGKRHSFDYTWFHSEYNFTSNSDLINYLQNLI